MLSFSSAHVPPGPPPQLYAICTFNVNIQSSQMQLKLNPGQTRAWPCSLFSRMSSVKRIHITTIWSSYPPAREARWYFGWDWEHFRKMSDLALALPLRKDKEMVDKQTEGGGEVPWLMKMNVKNWRKVICNEIWREQEQLNERGWEEGIVFLLLSPITPWHMYLLLLLYSSWIGNKWTGTMYSHLCAMVKLYRALIPPGTPKQLHHKDMIEMNTRWWGQAYEKEERKHFWYHII